MSLDLISNLILLYIEKVLFLNGDRASFHLAPLDLKSTALKISRAYKVRSSYVPLDIKFHFENLFFQSNGFPMGHLEEHTNKFLD